MSVRFEVSNWIRAHADRILGLCQDLVRIPSEDPPGDTRPICAFLEAYLLRAGLEARIVASDPRRPNLLAHLAFARDAPHVVFNGHMETLPVGDRSQWTYDPFSATIVDDRLYGRGAACMKGGIAALIGAALALGANRATLRGSLSIMLTSDEVNGGGLGTGHVLERLPETRGDVALVGEGGAGINFGHKGAVFLELYTEGAGGHGALSFARPSAVHNMLALLTDLRTLTDIEVAPPQQVGALIEAGRAFYDKDMGTGSTDALKRIAVNVGTISGGDKVNVVAQRCRADVDIRLPPGMTVDELLAKVREIVERHPRTTFRVASSSEPTASACDHPWFQTLQWNSAEVLGTPMPFLYSHAFTDARFFRLQKVPAAAIGGLHGRNVGGPDEHIRAESVVQMAELFALATFDYLSRAQT